MPQPLPATGLQFYQSFKQAFFIFASLKKYFKILLLTLATCCYFNTVFEFSDTEKKTNFEKETHVYIHTEKETIAHSAKIEKHIDELVQLMDGYHQHLIASQKSSPSFLSVYKNLPSPKSNKLYLYDSVFLI